jgi:hypothetical protein
MCFRACAKTSYRVVQVRQSGFRGYYFHGAIENIHFDNVAFQPLLKYHLLGILADICVPVFMQKPVIGLCRRGNQGSGDIIFMGSIENISFDDVALERLPKYHRFGILTDICVSVRVRKPVIGLCSRGNQGSGDIIFMGSIENISFDNVALERLPKYHRFGFLTDICVSVRAQKPFIGLCRRGNQGSWDIIFMGL